MQTRRSVLLAAATGFVPGGAGPLRLVLPEPGGPFAVGTVSLRLVDTARPDPWVAARPSRELMVSLRYPARAVDAFPTAAQILPGEAAGFAALNNFSGVPGGRVDWSATRTHAHQGAPVDERHGPYPVVCYSPGVLDPRSLGSTLCDDLASRGYVVVTIDHTYDASAVQFPGGRVERSVLPARFAQVAQGRGDATALLRKALSVRVADARFVLDQLPGAAQRRLLGCLDLRRIGMFGHSAGGFTAVQTMHDDPRIAAAADLDGVLAHVQDDHDPGHLSSAAADGLARPFLLIGKEGNDHRTVPSWGALWRHSTGRREELTLRGASHATYTDAVALLPQIARRLGLPRSTVVENIGTVPPSTAIRTTRSRLASFFGRELRDAPAGRAVRWEVRGAGASHMRADTSGV
ncbi:alpha/beta hydrolase [Streptomyces sp. NPDC002004]